MDRHTSIPLRVGAWCVDPASGQISRDGQTVRVEARTMRLLLCLAEHAGEVVSIDDLLNQAWAGVVVTPDSVYQGVASLRRLLGDDARQPAYIATVPRLGYRMVASVSPWVDEALTPVVPQSEVAAPSATEVNKTRARGKVGVLIAAAAAACLGLVLVLSFRSGFPGTSDPAVPGRSLAVLPFLDLTTQEMNEEYFADGLTEELIGRLSKVPGLRVTPPTSSFFFKGKQATVAEIAKSLGVAYVLDGSVRKSGDTLRIAARLIRAEDGYVVWSETYDRPFDGKLMAQDDIAGEVTKALSASID